MKANNFNKKTIQNQCRTKNQMKMMRDFKNKGIKDKLRN